MSSADVRSWIASSMAQAFGLSADAAEQMAIEAMDVAPSSLELHAGEIVALCRATVQLPWVAAWWQTDRGHRAFATLSTCPDNAWTALNEMCAAPAPDLLDPNWPAWKVFESVETPEGCQPGDKFVVGNGEGERYVMRVVEHDGRVGTELVRGLGTPLDSYWYQAIADARRISRQG